MLKLSIKIKVLLILVLLTIFMIVGMALSMQAGFNKGFFNYRKALDKQFSDNVVLTLKNYYQENKSWDAIKDNKRVWRELIVESSVGILNDEHFNPPPKRKHQRPPRNNSNRNKPFRRKPPENKRPRTQQLPPISLFDANKILIAGQFIRKKDELTYTSIKSNSEIIGYLGLHKNKNVHFKQDKMFADNIKSMLIKLLALMILVSIIVAFPIANYFTRSVNQITRATKKVASGDYSTRILINRKDELGDLADHFNLLAKTLEQNSESQKGIIADIAHELRTPISVIVGEIEAIQDGIHIADENTMNLLHSQISSLKNLVNDLHDLSESDLGSLKYEMHKFDLLSLINQSYQNHRLSFNQNDISLKINAVDSTCFILGDANRLNQLFNNVLSNSVQYTDKGGEAMIDVSYQGDFVLIKFSDSKPGLQTKQLGKIFDRWYRGDKSRNKNSGGSGLGLSICKEIVKAHNGEIIAQQSELGGIEIIIKLPIVIAPF